MGAKTSGKTQRVNPWVYAVWRALLCLVARVVYRYRLTGKENVPQKGAVIFAFNHLHMFDTVVLAPVTGRQIVPFAAKKWEHRGLAGWLLKNIGTIFIKRGEVDRQALRNSLRALKSGYPLVVAPEGTRSKTAQMQEARPGVAYMAHQAKVPVVPVALFGVETVGDWKRLRRPVCHVVVGEPFFLPDETKPTTADLKNQADLIMLKIALDLPESYRGVYAERARAIEQGESHVLDVLTSAEKGA